MANLRDGIGDWLKAFGPAFEAAGSYRWEGSSGAQAWEFLKRAAVRRQHEALLTILTMVDGGHGHFAVTFLRPAYEELIWLAYLNKHPSIANNLIKLIAQRDVLTSMRAQSDYLGPKAMKQIGFAPNTVANARKREDLYDTAIKAIGKRLRWPMTRWNPLPSMAFLSRETGYERQYNFLYQATSRFVHFSTHELFRRVWGKKGEVKIGSTSFAAFWAEFAMYWGLWLFIHTVVECHDVLGDADITPEERDRLDKWLGSIAAMPILAAEELEAWPEERT